MRIYKSALLIVLALLLAGILPVAAASQAAAGEESSAVKAAPAKSKGKAFLLSLLLPGMGERYAGARGRSQGFLGAELTLWLGYAGFVTWSDWRQEESRSYAASHAGADPAGKDDIYYVNIGNYDDIYQYNAAKLRQRNLNDYYRDVEAMYWKWDSAASKAQFDRIRLASERASNRATFMLGAIFANHLVSAIDAVWSVHKYNSRAESQVGWNLQFGDGVLQPRVLFSLQARF